MEKTLVCKRVGVRTGAGVMSCLGEQRSYSIDALGVHKPPGGIIIHVVLALQMQPACPDRPARGVAGAYTAL